MIKLLNYLGLVKGCYLEDMWGEQYTTAYRITPSGKRAAPVYFFTGVGHVILNDDGSCSGQSTYISKWKAM